MVAGIEETLELWASSLRDVKARMAPLFTQERVATSAGLFIDGLLSSEQRKTGWLRAEAAGDPGPWRQQAILGRGRWDADALRDIVRQYALETLADDQAVLIIDETGFLKQGRPLVGSGGSIRDRRARSPTARSASSLLTRRAMDMPLSTAPFICRRPGRMIRSGCKLHMYSRERSLRPNRAWRLG